MGPQKFWLKKARRLAARRNLAASLDIFLPAILALSVLAAAALILLRMAQMPTALLLQSLGGAMLLAAAVSWFFARRKFLKSSDALVRLDDLGKLHNRLTAAEAGVGDWPAAQSVRETARWNWPRLLGPLALAAFLLCGSTWLPIPQHAKAAHPTEAPIAWSQVESWLQALEQAKLIEPEALQKLQEQLDALREQPAENWYRQNSLEAGDTLREQTAQALRSTLNDLQKSEETLAAAERAGDTLPPNELKTLGDALQKSAHGLEIGNLPLNKELLNNLKKFDPSKAKQLDAGQLAEMRDKLKAGAKVCEQCVGVSDKVKNSLGSSQPTGAGPGGGGSPAPLALKEDATNLHTKQTDTISNEDLARAAPGDVIGMNKGEHEVKKIEPGQIAAGAIQSPGKGGDAVWRDSLTPQEREVLQRFFK